MVARIFKPAKSATQSGTGRTKLWLLEYEMEKPLAIEPLMGWTSSSDMRKQVRLGFNTKEEAVGYCEKHGIPFEVFEPKEPTRRLMAYSDNFAFSRRTPWTH